ncbi:MAG: hypothetical protein LLG20_24990 [Acidobacteriales bacterium]|nr:hypothetical protein [Terriglobales bacterium]
MAERKWFLFLQAADVWTLWRTPIDDPQIVSAAEINLAVRLLCVGGSLGHAAELIRSWWIARELQGTGTDIQKAVDQAWTKARPYVESEQAKRAAVLAAREPRLQAGAVLAFVAGEGAVNARKLASRFKVEPSAAQRMLSRLFEARRVIRVGRGIYAPTPAPPVNTARRTSGAATPNLA